MPAVPFVYSQTVVIETPGPIPLGNSGPWKIHIYSPKNDETTAMASDNFVNDLASRVGRIETDLGGVRQDVSSIKTKVDHFPTRAELYLSALAVLALLIGAAWAFATGPLASAIAKSLAH